MRHIFGRQLTPSVHLTRKESLRHTSLDYDMLTISVSLFCGMHDEMENLSLLKEYVCFMTNKLLSHCNTTSLGSMSPKLI